MKIKNSKIKSLKDFQNQKKLKNEITLTKGMKKIDVSPISKKNTFQSKFKKEIISKKQEKRKEKNFSSLKNIFYKNLKKNLSSGFFENNFDNFKLSFRRSDSFINDSISNSNYLNKSFLTIRSVSKLDSLYKLKEENIDFLRDKLTPIFEYSFFNYLKLKLKNK